MSVPMSAGDRVPPLDWRYRRTCLNASRSALGSPNALFFPLVRGDSAPPSVTQFRSTLITSWEAMSIMVVSSFSPILWTMASLMSCSCSRMEEAMAFQYASLSSLPAGVLPVVRYCRRLFGCRGVARNWSGVLVVKWIVHPILVRVSRN